MDSRFMDEYVGAGRGVDFVNVIDPGWSSFVMLASACSASEVSRSRILVSDPIVSHGGGIMLALCCFFKSSASHNGMVARCGGTSVGVVP